MGQTNDCKYAALQDHVFFGNHISDMWRDYLNTLGLSSKQINDMEYEFLTDAGFADGELNDRWFAWLRFKGFTGALPDMWNRYWCDVANNVPGNPGLPAAWLLNASFDTYVDGNDLTLFNGDELHDDYPTNGVGKIRKGSLVLHSATGTMVLSGGVAQFTGSSDDDLIEIAENAVGLVGLAGISVAQRGLIGSSGWPVLWSRAVNPSSAASDYAYRMQQRGTGVIAMQYSDGVATQEEVDLDLGLTLNQDNIYSIVRGGYNVSGEPDPLGGYGALYLINNILRYGSQKGTDVGRRLTFLASASVTDWTLNSMQTKIDLPKLATPWRGLFATDHADIADYVPENGPPLAVVKGGMETDVGGFANSTLDGVALISIAVYDNPGGGYWEANLATSGNANHITGIVFRYLDAANYWVCDVDGAAAVYNMRIREVIADAEFVRATQATTIAAGNTTPSRFIVTDDGTNITMIAPGDGSVASHSSTAGASRTVAGILSRGNGGINARIYWHCARKGTVSPYLFITLLSEPGDYNLTPDEAGSHDYSVYFSGTAPLTYAFVGGPITGLTFDTATGILSGTPTVEAAYPRHVTATNAAGMVATGLHNITVAEVSFPTAGLIAHYDPSDISTLFQLEGGTVPVVDDGDPVGFMADKVGTNDWIQSTTSAKPEYRSPGPNGLGAIFADATDDTMGKATAFDVLVPYTIVLCEQPQAPAASTRRTLSAGSTGVSSNCLISAARTGGLNAYVDGVVSATSTLTGVTSAGILTMEAGTSSFHLDGVDVTAPTPATNQPWGDIGLGFRGGNSEPANSIICEVLIYDRALTTQEIADTNAYLKTKWGIA